jgi:non-specific serine/threonine protein kinase
LGLIALVGGEQDEAVRLFADELAVCRLAGDAVGVAHLLMNLAAAVNYQAEDRRAIALLEEALALARELPDPRLAAVLTSEILSERGVVARGQGRLDAAFADHEEALRLQRSVDYDYGVLHTLGDLADVARDRGDLALAGERYGESLRLALAFGQRRVVLWSLEGIACVLAGAGQAVRATRLFGAVERLRETTGLGENSPVDRAVSRRAIAAGRAALGEAGFAAAWAAGRSWSVADAVVDALHPTEVRRLPSGVGLSPRELEVARLLVAGKTDREIGDALFISRRTVESHVARIFEKTGVRTRSAATAVIVTAGLIDPAPGPPRS